MIQTETRNTLRTTVRVIKVVPKKLAPKGRPYAIGETVDSGRSVYIPDKMIEGAGVHLHEVRVMVLGDNTREGAATELFAIWAEPPVTVPLPKGFLAASDDISNRVAEFDERVLTALQNLDDIVTPADVAAEMCLDVQTGVRMALERLHSRGAVAKVSVYGSTDEAASAVFYAPDVGTAVKVLELPEDADA